MPLIFRICPKTMVDTVINALGYQLCIQSCFRIDPVEQFKEMLWQKMKSILNSSDDQYTGP